MKRKAPLPAQATADRIWEAIRNHTGSLDSERYTALIATLMQREIDKQIKLCRQDLQSVRKQLSDKQAEVKRLRKQVAQCESALSTEIDKRKSSGLILKPLPEQETP